MKDQLKTIREAHDLLIGGDLLCEVKAAGLLRDALTQLEAMVGEQGPYGIVTVVRRPGCADQHWFYRHPEPPYLDNAAECHTVYTTQPAQQPQARPDFNDEWTGYLKDGETPFERFLRERKDMQSVLKLYQRALEENERLQGQQPQAETDESIAADAYVIACQEMEQWQHERRKAGKDAGTTGSLVDGIAWLYGYIDDLEAKQPQAEVVPSDVVCAVAAEREACARQCEDIYSWRGAYSAGPMCTPTLEAAAAAIRARDHAAIAQQKGQP